MKRPLSELTRPGWVLVVAGAVLFTMGMLSIYGSSAVQAGGGEISGQAFAVRQGIAGLIALAAAVVILRIGYLPIVRQAYPLFGVCLALLVPMIVANFFNTSLGGLVPESRGAHRWIKLPGMQLQPSELMKVALILALAWYLRYRRNYRHFAGLLLPFAIALVPMVLILTEPNLGTFLLFIPVIFGMLFVAGARFGHLAAIVAAGLVLTPVLWTGMKDYQRRRVSAVLLQSADLRNAVAADPDRYSFLGVDRREALEWEASSGMQLVRSKAALGSGGLLGQGWGQGTYVEYNFLPDRHNDFVFALVGHQWGLIGCLVVLACYAVIVLAGVEIASVTTEPCGRLLAAGVVCLIGSQVFINVGMTVGLMPITGMTLPFVSYGGSSLLGSFLALALLISVSQHRPFMLARKPFEWAQEPPVRS